MENAQPRQRLQQWREHKRPQLMAALAAVKSFDNRKHKPIPDFLIHVRMVKRFRKSFAPEGGHCWLWKGRSQGGRATFIMGAKTYLAARVQYRLHTGTDPGQHCVCHRCDNPLCVNPDHLYLGTHTDNMRDARSKNRINSAKGESHGCAKLRDQDVVFIRSVAGQLSQRKIAAQFGINQKTVFDIIHRNIWRHL